MAHALQPPPMPMPQRIPNLFVFAVLLLGLGATTASQAASSEGSSTSREGARRYIVELRDLGRGKAAIAAGGGEVVLELGPQRAVAALLPEAALKALARHPAIASIEVDAPRYPFAQTTPYGTTLTQANLVWPDATGAGRKVCVIDSGLALGHPDLQTTGVTGYPSDWANDVCGHGTHVTGTIAALNNTAGVVGMLPGGVALHVVKVFGENCDWSYTSSLVDAANRCRDAGAHVINMSLGGPYGSSFEQSAFQQLYDDGILLVAAAGNDGNTALSYPASYASVISVAAVHASKNHANFSQRNAGVELAAPGVYVASTVPWGYESWSGTSMASPHVAGAAALIWSVNPAWTNVQLRDALQQTAEDLGVVGRDHSYGFGLIRTRAALDHLLNVAPPNVPPAPAMSVSCVGLTCTFTDASTDSDGTVSAWKWVFGDGASSMNRHPTHTFASGGNWRVSLTVIDDDGAVAAASFAVSVTAPPPPPKAPILLQVQGSRARARTWTHLSWSGVSTPEVEIYRNGVRVSVQPNIGGWRDNLRQAGTAPIHYEVCEPRRAWCSAKVTATF